MRQNFPRQLIVLISISIATSCSPLYVPSIRTFDHFSSKRQVRVSGMMDLAGFESHTSASITDHLTVSCSFFSSVRALANSRDTTSINGHLGNHNHRKTQLGAGYYGKIFNIPVEFSGGYSRGKSTAYEGFPSHDGFDEPLPGTYPSRYIRGAYNRLFIKAGAAVFSNNRTTIAFLVNVSAVRFFKIESQTKAFLFNTKNEYVFLEPAFDFKHNIERTPLYVVINAGFSHRVDNTPRAKTNRGSVPETWVLNNTFGIGIQLHKKDHD